MNSRHQIIMSSAARAFVSGACRGNRNRHPRSIPQTLYLVSTTAVLFFFSSTFTNTYWEHDAINQKLDSTRGGVVLVPGRCSVSSDFEDHSPASFPNMEAGCNRLITKVTVRSRGCPSVLTNEEPTCQRCRPMSIYVVFQQLIGRRSSTAEMIDLRVRNRFVQATRR